MAQKENGTPASASNFKGVDKQVAATKFLRELTVLYPHVAATLAEIANIPSEQREVFGKKIVSLLQSAHLAIVCRADTPPGAFEEIEAAARTLRRAILRLPRDQYLAFACVLWSAYWDLSAGGASPLGDLVPPLRSLDAAKVATAMRLPVTRRAIRALALAGSRLANKDPNRRDGAGGAQNWAFTGFVRVLWQLAHNHGGKLTANTKHGRGVGSMFTALEELRPIFGELSHAEGFIPNVLPAQTIANVVKAERNKRSTST